MGFLKTQTPQPKNYAALGYTTNPFPPLGSVRPEVYAERPEAEPLNKALENFIFRDGPGKLYVLEGQRGVGKSNLLKHIEWQLTDLNYPSIAFRYIASQLFNPRQLSEEVLQAIGVERIKKWIESGRFETPERLNGTDLRRFLNAVQDPKQSQDTHSATNFLVRWLSGHQTYAKERQQYGIWNSERLQPALSFPYIQAITEQMIASKHLGHILLLIDEAEDIASDLRRAGPYVMALKALVNSFNFAHLFIILAGQEGSISRLGQVYSSLASRWEIVQLEPLVDSDDAIKLAHAYMNHAQLPGFNRELRPSTDEIVGIFSQLHDKFPTQRALLSDLHKWLDDRLE